MRTTGINVQVAAAEDAGFIRDMARHAATLEDRPLPPPDAEDVTELLPASSASALVAVTASGRNLGAAWWRTGTVPLIPSLSTAPELAMAVDPEARRGGVGTVLLLALLEHARMHGHPVLVLNVHLRNTAALHLYMKCGFRVAAAGRGWFGVAMRSSPGGF